MKHKMIKLASDTKTESHIVIFYEKPFLVLNGVIVTNSSELSRGEICVANLKAPLQMVRVWTGF